MQYANLHHWQAAVELVRFEAPLEDCVALAKRVSDEEHVMGLRDLGSLNNDARRVLWPLDVTPLVAPWFTPEVIRQGQFAGQHGSHNPRIWIDNERGEVDYLYTD